MFHRDDIVRITNPEGCRKCLIIPGFLQYPDFYEDEVVGLPYKYVDVVDLRWNDKEMIRDKMQIQFIEGLYLHIRKENYDTIFVHGISDSIVCKLQLFGEITTPIVYMSPYCIAEEERERQYNKLCLYLRFRKYIPVKLQILLFNRALLTDDDYYSLYLLNVMREMSDLKILRRFEDSLVSIEQTQLLSGIFIYGEDDNYSWYGDDDVVIKYAGHYPMHEEFRKTMHMAEKALISLYKDERKFMHA